MPSTIEKIRAQARKDAKRYSEAQMNYGKGAGNRRKILDAELKEKLKDDIYKAAFEAALAGINKADVAKKIEQKKGLQRAVNNAKKGVRAARRANNFYNRNHTWIDDLLRLIFGE